MHARVVGILRSPPTYHRPHGFTSARQRLGKSQEPACHRGLTLDFAPRSSAKSKPGDGNLPFMALIRLSGSLAFLSSSSKANKYLSVNSTAVLESSGDPTLLCPEI